MIKNKCEYFAFCGKLESPAKTGASKNVGFLIIY